MKIINPNVHTFMKLIFLLTNSSVSPINVFTESSSWIITWTWVCLGYFGSCSFWTWFLGFCIGAWVLNRVVLFAICWTILSKVSAGFLLGGGGERWVWFWCKGTNNEGVGEPELELAGEEDFGEGSCVALGGSGEYC